MLIIQADPWEENEDSSPALNTDESVEKMMKKCKLGMLNNKPGEVSEECINTVKGKTAFDLAHDKPEVSIQLNYITTLTF
jgi:hypothetical protein